MATETLTPLNIYAAALNNEILFCLNNWIEDNTVSLKVALMERYELSFTAQVGLDDTTIVSSLQEGMYLYVENTGFFVVGQPNITIDGDAQIINVSAESCDAELENIFLNVSINTGEEASLERAIKYDGDFENEYLLSPVTGVPLDWIVIKNTFEEQLTAFKNALAGATVTSGKYILTTGSEICNKFEAIKELIPRLTVLSSDKYDNAGGYYEYIEKTSTGYTVVKSVLDDRIDELKNFYARYGSMLSLTDTLLEKTHGAWTCELYKASNNDYSLSNTKIQSEFDGSIYSFFTSEMPGKLYYPDPQNTDRDENRCIPIFDYINRKITIMPVSAVGEETGVTLAYRTLLNELHLGAENDDMATRLYVTMSGDTETGIEEVNCGQSYVEDLNYKHEAGLISDALWTKYQAYLTAFETDRQNYVSWARTARQKRTEINELTYRVPSDDLKNEWGTYSADELNMQETAIKNLRLSLLNLYNEDYPNGMSGGSVNMNVMKNTIYYYDYMAYTDMLEQIKIARVVGGDYSTQENWESYDFRSLYGMQDRTAALNEAKNKANAYQTDWQLYGKSELEAKINGYKEQMNTLIKKGLTNEGSVFDIQKWVDAGISLTTGSGFADFITDENGNTAIRVSNYQSGEVYTTESPAYAIRPETEYEITFDVTGSDTNELFVFFYQRNGSPAYISGNTYFVSTQGTSMTFTTPSNAANIKIRVDNNSGGSGGSASATQVVYKNLAVQGTDKYNVKPWSALTDSEKKEYGGEIGAAQYTSRYNDFDIIRTNYLDATNALLGVNGVNAQISELEGEYKAATDKMELVNQKYSKFIYLVNVINNSANTSEYSAWLTKATAKNIAGTSSYAFDEEEAAVLFKVTKESDYNNENYEIFQTDTSDEIIDKLEALREDALTEASKSSRPQLTFTTDIDNMFCLIDEKTFWSDFLCGNWVNVEYKEGLLMKLRMMAYEYNPVLPDTEDFNISYSTLIKSRNGISDIEYILGKQGGSSGRSSRGSGGGSGSDGTDLGTVDKIDVTISNTMLSKLLKSGNLETKIIETVNSQLDVGKLSAKVVAIGDIATSGATIIDGGNITTGIIKSANYNETNHTGSLLDLTNGALRLGDKFVWDGSGLGTLKLGDKFTWNGTSLSIEGNITATTGKIGMLEIYSQSGVNGLKAGSMTPDGTTSYGYDISDQGFKTTLFLNQQQISQGGGYSGDFGWISLRKVSNLPYVELMATTINIGTGYSSSTAQKVNIGVQSSVRSGDEVSIRGNDATIGSPDHYLKIGNTNGSTLNMYNSGTADRVITRSILSDQVAAVLPISSGSSNGTISGTATKYYTYYQRTKNLCVVWGRVVFYAADATSATSDQENQFNYYITRTIPLPVTFSNSNYSVSVNVQHHSSNMFAGFSTKNTNNFLLGFRYKTAFSGETTRTINFTAIGEVSGLG